MNIKSEFKSIISKFNPNLDVEWDPARQDEIKLLTRNPEDTIRFIETEMSADDLCWMAEVFDEVFCEIYSPRLEESLRKAFEKYKGQEDVEWAYDAFSCALDLVKYYDLPKPGFKIP